jgi:YegS/Rv2252/BmrU family lipid kinase
MSYARVIINPVAGAGRAAKAWCKISHLLHSVGLSFEHDITESPGHAVELAKSAAERGYELVVSVGGDGTINEVVNGLYNSGGIKDITLGIISTGTGADYVRSCGFKHSLQEACLRLVNPKKLVVDIGTVEYTNNGQKVKRVFVNCAGLGFAAEIVKATTQRYKTLGSKPSYLAGLIATFLLYRNRTVALSIGDSMEEKEVCTVLVSKGKYAGGSMLIAPQADLTDGFLDIITIEGMSKADLLWSLPRIYKGTHLTHPKVTLKKAKEVSIQSKQQTFLQTDGEILGPIPARFEVLPAMLNLAI